VRFHLELRFQTGNFRLVQDYRPGWKEVGREKMFLEPRTEEGEKALKLFSEKEGRNQLSNVHIPSKDKTKTETRLSLRFNESLDELLSALLGKSPKASKKFGYKIPSLRELESEIATNPALKSAMAVFWDHTYPSIGYGLYATFSAVTASLLLACTLKGLASQDQFMANYGLALVPAEAVKFAIAGVSVDQAQKFARRKRSLKMVS